MKALIVIVVSSVEDPDRIQLDPVCLGHPDPGDQIRILYPQKVLKLKYAIIDINDLAPY